MSSRSRSSGDEDEGNVTGSTSRPTSDAPANGAQRAGAEYGGEVEEISVLRLLNVLLRHRRAVLLCSLGAALLLVGISLVLPRDYTSRASFAPQLSEGSLSRLAGLAAQFGVSVPTQTGARSPEFYADLLRSRHLLRGAVETGYEVPSADGEGATRSGDLVELFGIDAEPRELAVVEAVERLRESLAVSTRSETGVVQFAVTTGRPELSRDVAERMLDLLHRFNLETRQSEASAERAFVAGRLEDVEGELRAAEERLKEFLQNNRRYDNSPELRFEYERLQRQVSLHQQVYTSLAEAHETAKVEEVRNTPVITVVDPPDLPVEHDSRHLPLKAVLGLLLGLMAGVAWAFGREVVANARDQDPGDYEEFDRLRRESKEDLERLLSLGGRRQGAGTR